LSTNTIKLRASWGPFQILDSVYIVCTVTPVNKFWLLVTTPIVCIQRPRALAPRRPFQQMRSHICWWSPSDHCKLNGAHVCGKAQVYWVVKVNISTHHRQLEVQYWDVPRSAYICVLFLDQLHPFLSIPTRTFLRTSQILDALVWVNYNDLTATSLD
jgi:hypothetical protein